MLQRLPSLSRMYLLYRVRQGGSRALHNDKIHIISEAKTSVVVSDVFIVSREARWFARLAL